MADRLLFVDHAPAMGGAERSLLLLMQRLDSVRWKPVFAGCAGDFFDDVRRKGIEAHEVSLPRLRRSAGVMSDWYKGSRQVAHIARQVDARALIANTVRAAIYAAPAARLSRRLFVWYMRDFWLSESKPAYPAFDRLGKRLLMAAAAFVISNSQAVAINLPQTARIQVIHNGLEPAEWDHVQDGFAFRNRYMIPAGAPLVGMVGRLRPWKGQAEFLEMAARVLKSRPEVHFALVGGSLFDVQDDYAARLQQQVQELDLVDRAHFTGQIADVAGALAAMDVFVHPGSPEPFGLVNIEAMAMARPVVAFAHGALPEIVDDGRTGILVPPRDIAALAGAVNTLLEDSRSSDRMGQAGRERMLQHFTISRVAAEFDALMAGLTAGKRSS